MPCLIKFTFLRVGIVSALYRSMITQTFQSQGLSIEQTDSQSKVVNIFQQLFVRRDQWQDLGLVKHCVTYSSDKEDTILVKRNKTATDEAMMSNLAEVYISQTECKCGGNWTRQVIFSKYPYACQHCRCVCCGVEKLFKFIFSEK